MPRFIKMKKLKNIHPGEILKEEFLDEMEISAYKLAKDLKIPQTRISEIVKGKRRISADTALRLSLYFNNSAKFWIGLQDDYDIEEAMQKGKNSFKEITQFVRVAV
jgi:antitoxin HigA-1